MPMVELHHSVMHRVRHGMDSGVHVPMTGFLRPFASPSQGASAGLNVTVGTGKLTTVSQEMGPLRGLLVPGLFVHHVGLGPP
jgi:hypothetical protein